MGRLGTVATENKTIREKTNVMTFPVQWGIPHRQEMLIQRFNSPPYSSAHYSDWYGRDLVKEEEGENASLCTHGRECERASEKNCVCIFNVISMIENPGANRLPVGALMQAPVH